MKIQHREMINHSIKIQKGDNKHQQKVEDKDKINIGVIAVSQGEGLNEIFESLGADIIDGGQSMNPSTEDIFALVEEKTYEHTIILPNNKNIILTAEQVKGLSKNNVYVLPTKSIPQGISALLAFNPDFTINDNISNMSQNMKNVISGEVTYAVRDTKWNNTKINKGDVIGIKEGKLQIIGNDLEETAVDLIDLMTKDKREGIITIYYGLTVKESTIKKTMEALAQKHEDYDIEYYFGGQDLYQFIISVE